MARIGFSLTFAILLFSFGALAAPTKDEAAAAYDRGAAAYDKGDFLVAATELARADELAHSPVTLELALSAAVRADDPVLGMTLVDRVEKRKATSKTLDTVVDKARKKLAPRVGKLNVACASSSSSCEVMVDGAAFEPGAPRYVSVGPHKVSVTLPKTEKTIRSTERYDVVIETGKTIEVTATATPSPAEATPPTTEKPPAKETPSEPTREATTSSSGLSSTWFWVGLGLTAVAGGAAIASALDTRSKHEAFFADRSSVAASEAGQLAETRTYVITAGVGVLALATAAIGLFLVDWKGKNSTRGASR